MEFLYVLFDRTLDIVLKPVGQELGYLFCFKSKVKELNENAEGLQRERERLQHEVEDAERNGKRIHAPVSDWLLKVDEIFLKTEEFQKDGSNAKTKCSNCLFPNLIVRHRLGKRVAKLALDVDKLLKDSKFGEVSYRPSPTWLGSIFSEISYESLKSRNETVEEIMKALTDSSARTIGIYGQGGVGKTTLVKEVARKALEMELFKVVVMAVVTRNPQIKYIQGQIADMLGMTLEEETEIGRAGQLQERLKKDKENTLVILDDLWFGVDLNKLGVPVHNDHFNQCVKNGFAIPGNMSEKEESSDNNRGCKILLTSRSKEVLSTQMDVNENSIFSVGVLEEKEAEMLLKKVAGLHDKNSEIDSLALKIAKKCAGLPVALVTVGSALKNKSPSVWTDAFRRQEFIGVQESMEFSTKLSYDHLESEELKATFLLSAQMGNDFLIMDLLKYCIGLGILEGVYTISEARDRLHVLVRRLKDSSLLLDSYSSDRFTMHDIIRDAALSIALKEQYAFIKRCARLDEWLDKDKLEKYTTISLHYCDIVNELPECINCPRLKVFHVENNDHSLKIPDKLFEGMTELRVLLLTGIDLSHFPSSIKCLKNLRMLCLEQCVIGDELSMIGELKNLRILSLSGSELKCFPSELGHLCKLQLLDITNCSMPTVIPPNVISCLKNLEELYMRKNFVQRELEGQTNASLAELSHLNQLTTLDIHIPDLNVFPENLFFGALDYFKITVGDIKMFLLEGFKMPDQYEASRTLALQLEDGNNIHSQMGIKLLFKTVENLLLGELGGVENIFYELNLLGFPCLKHLYIANNFGIKYIINSMNFLLPQEVFTNLESLHLYNLENLKTICCSHLTGASFRMLKVVKIKMCHQLQYLFSVSMVRLFTNLATIKVSECDALKEIVDVERQGDNETEVGDDEVDKIEFPQLRHVALQGLSKFTGFCTNGMLLFSETIEIPNLENLELSSIKISHIWGDMHPSSTSNFQFLIKLDVNNCGNLKYLLSISMAGYLVNLKILHVSNCEGMEELLIQEDSINTTNVHIFCNLKEIKLSYMRNLREIWHRPGNQVGSDSYCNLESVVIEECKKLVTVFPPHIAGMLKKLDSVVVEYSELVEVIFDIENISPIDSEEVACLRNISIFSLQNLKHVWNRDPKGILNFKNLQDVKVFDCHSIKNLFPFSIARGLQQLESIHIGYCEGMEQIVCTGNGSNVDSVTFAFPKLNLVRLKRLPELKGLYLGMHNIEWPQLKNLDLSDCDKLVAFMEETTNPKRLPISSEQVIPNLQSLGLGNKEAKLLSRFFDNYHLNSLKTLELEHLKNPELLIRFLHRAPNLEKLDLWRCDFQELFPPRMLTALEKIGIVVQLKVLTLSSLSFLHNIGFEQVPVIFQRLQRLNLLNCGRLINLVPGSICFAQLTYLKVGWCDGLINLMEFSTAKSLSQLMTLEVTYCRVIEEIVAEKGSRDERENEIVFGRLTTLKLDSLENLKCFCSSKYWSFMFPLLESLVVRKCPKMKIFSRGVTKAPKLRKVHFAKGEEEGTWYWSDNLNYTIQKVFTDTIGLEYIEDLKLYDYPQLEQLWHGKVPLPENCFTNLKSLVVENCEFLSTVIPCDLLPYFKNLEELQVRSCSSIEQIFDIVDIKTGGILFNLEKLTLERLPNLKNIFFKHSEYLRLSHGPQLEEGSNGKVHRLENCFRNLKTLVVERCDFLSIVIPCNLVPCLKNLEELEVQSCHSIERIFDINDELMTSETKGLAFPLMNLTLYNLLALKNVWKLLKNCQGLFSFPNLQNVSVSSCQSLNFLFPASLAKNLLNLENLEIANCEVMEEIIRKDEEAAEGAISKFSFPSLTILTLEGLLELKCFYPGRHNLEFPMLNSLNVFHCGKLEIFTQELLSYKETGPYGDIGSSIAGQPLLSFQEVIPKMENLSLNPKDTKLLSRGEFLGSLHKIKGLKLQCFHNINEGETLPYGFLNNLPNIEILKVFCSGFKVIFPSQMPEVDYTRILAQLRRLSLKLLPSLKSIGLEHSCLDPLCNNLQVLKVRGCNRLTTLVQSAVSFCNLKELSISSCHDLEYLFTSSTAKSLVLLENMSINSSKSIKEIIAKEGDEPSLDEMIFGKLKALSLISLPSLLSFYTGNAILNFPSLETVIIHGCPRLKFFSQGVINAPMLGAIIVSLEYDLCWDTDLNTTVMKICNEKVYLQQYEYLKLPEYREVEKVWHGEVSLQKACFGNLETLVVENCDFLLNVIPSHLLLYLKNLKRLKVKNCIQAKEIFDINDINMAEIEEVSFSLEILTLDQLPNLLHVWGKDPEGIACFRNLQVVQVTNCNCLKSLFTTSLSKKLEKLEKLTIESCESMEEIVGKNEAAVESTTTEFVFPWLTLLVLSENRELKFFYAGRNNLVCKNLKYLRVYHCDKLEMFTLKSRRYEDEQAQDHQGGISVVAQPLFSIQKVIPKLEEVSLNEKETTMLWREESKETLLRNVKCLQLYCFHSVNEAGTLPFGFLLEVPNMETLAIACSEFKEIFPSWRLVDDHSIKLAQLKGLRLMSLSELNSIGLEHSWQDRLCENLEILNIWRCPRLTTIVQSAVCFSNLKELLINQCHGLKCLFTSLTAKSLVGLKVMSIEECGLIKEIVAKEEGESSQDEIIFEQLRKISLNSLPSLTSFYAGNSSLNLPSLHKVIITQCPKMKIFSQGSISAPVLMGIQASLDEYTEYDEYVEYDVHWDGNLNSTIEQLFHEKEAIVSREKLIY